MMDKGFVCYPELVVTVIDELPPGVGRNKGRDVRSFHVRDDSCADYLLPGCPGWHFREGCVLLLHGARHKEAQLWEVMPTLLCEQISTVNDPFSRSPRPLQLLPGNMSPALPASSPALLPGAESSGSGLPAPPATDTETESNFVADVAVSRSVVDGLQAASQPLRRGLPPVREHEAHSSGPAGLGTSLPSQAELFAARKLITRGSVKAAPPAAPPAAPAAGQADSRAEPDPPGWLGAPASATLAVAATVSALAVRPQGLRQGSALQPKARMRREVAPPPGPPSARLQPAPATAAAQALQHGRSPAPVAARSSLVAQPTTSAAAAWPLSTVPPPPPPRAAAPPSGKPQPASSLQLITASQASAPLLPPPAPSSSSSLPVEAPVFVPLSAQAPPAAPSPAMHIEPAQGAAAAAGGRGTSAYEHAGTMYFDYAQYIQAVALSKASRPPAADGQQAGWAVSSDAAAWKETAAVNPATAALAAAVPAAAVRPVAAAVWPQPACLAQAGALASVVYLVCASRWLARPDKYALRLASRQLCAAVDASVLRLKRLPGTHALPGAWRLGGRYPSLRLLDLHGCQDLHVSHVASVMTALPQLTELNLSGCGPLRAVLLGDSEEGEEGGAGSSRSSLTAALRRMVGMRRLTLDSAQLSRQLMEALAGLPALTSLAIKGGSDLAADVADCLSTLTQLSELTLEARLAEEAEFLSPLDAAAASLMVRPLGEQPLLPLAALQQLSSLTLANWDLEDHVLASIATMRNLRQLDLSRCRPMPDCNITCMSALAKLHSLALPPYEDQDAHEVLAYTSSLTWLKTLSLTCATITPELAEGLQLPEARRIALHGWLKGGALPMLLHALRLKAFKLKGAGELDPVNIMRLARLPQLASLHLAGCTLTDAGLHPLRYLSCLQVLKLNDCGDGATGEVFTSLSCLTQLSRVVLKEWPQLSDAGLQGLGQLPALRSLSIVPLGCGISDTGLASLAAGAAARQLTCLQLTAAACVTPAGLSSAVGCMPGLLHLSLEGAGVTDEVVRDGVVQLRQLTSLCFDDSLIGYASLELLQKLPCLHKLSARRCRDLGDGVAHHLAAIRRRSGVLRGVRLQGCPLSAATRKELRDGLGLVVNAEDEDWKAL